MQHLQILWRLTATFPLVFVDIDLTEYQEGDNGREAYEDFKVVLPGDLISKIPTVTNKGEPCWLRAKIAYGNTSDTLDGFSDDNISGITEDWVKIGEYYYYKNILDKGETVDIFTGVTIPSTWTEEHADQSLAVGIVAEAIQAANYKPDFESMSHGEMKRSSWQLRNQTGKKQNALKT